jgi:disulfide bond formation protein DsbB
MIAAMDADLADPLLALLALIALGLALLTVATMLIASLAGLRHEIVRWAIPIGLAVAAVATAGSLNYSEHIGYTPCEYCWYQRIAMYPMVVLFGIALLVKDTKVWRYTLPISIIGAGLSIYHFQLQRWPDQGSSCDAAAPCTFQWVDEFGFMSIPFMALCGFLLIATLSAAMWQDSRGI